MDDRPLLEKYPRESDRHGQVSEIAVSATGPCGGSNELVYAMQLAEEREILTGSGGVANGQLDTRARSS